MSDMEDLVNREYDNEPDLHREAQETMDGPSREGMLPPAVVEQQPVTNGTTDPAQRRTLEITKVLEDGYAKMSTLKLTKEEETKLRAPFSDEDVEIRPHDGLLYIPHILVSERLSDVFGVGQWGMVRRREVIEGGVIMAEWVLIVRGAVIGDGWGAQSYQPNNPKSNYRDALEGTRGEAIRAIAGKSLGCGSQVWMPRYCREWQAKYAQRIGTKWGRKESPSKASPKQGVSTPQTPTKTPPAPTTAPASGNDDDDQIPGAEVTKKRPANFAAYRKRFVEILGKLGDYGRQFALTEGYIFGDEQVEHVNDSSVPLSADELNEIMMKFGDFLMELGVDGDDVKIIIAKALEKDNKPKPKEAKPAAQAMDLEKGQRPWDVTPVPEWWTKLKIDQGKEDVYKGMMFSDLSKGYLWWWCVKWQPKPYKGNIKKEEKELRKMLDQAKVHYQFEDNEE